MNIIDFWRGWHMTLSRFLRDYLCIARGGNRKGPIRRYANLLITMLLGGLLHSAGWTSVFWGALHGIYLVTKHGWHALRSKLGFPPGEGTFAGRLAARTVTFLAVVVAWVFFRAEDLGDALTMLSGMAGLSGIALPTGLASHFGPLVGVLAKVGIGFDLGGGTNFVFTNLWGIGLGLVAFFLPNSPERLARHDPSLATHATSTPGTRPEGRLGSRNGGDARRRAAHARAGHRVPVLPVLSRRGPCPAPTFA